MHEILFWLYLVNAVLLINHEIDSAYWKEWQLFRLPGGIAGFLVLHFPLLFLVLYGLVLLDRGANSSVILSLLLSLGGVFAFSIHTLFIRSGRQEFKSPISQIILWATLLISLVQFVVTLLVL